MFVIAGCSQAPKGPAPITAEAKAYVRSLKLGDIEMQESESFAGGKLVEILGNVSNAGERPLKQVEINCVFHDAYGQVVLRQRWPIVRASSGGLKPGETKPFRLPFDTLPASWNQAMPQVVIASIEFAG
jgi:hypothetical protein